jgi:hypothetical protein
MLEARPEEVCHPHIRVLGETNSRDVDAAEPTTINWPRRAIHGNGLERRAVVWQQLPGNQIARKVLQLSRNPLCRRRERHYLSHAAFDQ